MGFLRNPYYDEHFDLTEPNQIVGKTLALVGKQINEDEVLSRSVQMLGWAVYGRWERVNSIVQRCIGSNSSIAEETVMILLLTELNYCMQYHLMS